MSEPQILKKLGKIEGQLEQVAKKLLEHDERFDLVAKKLLEHDERFDQIVTRDEFMAAQEMNLTQHDQIITMLKRLDQEYHFTQERIKRLEAKDPN